jgi:CRISPR system Cascade subunit CasA
VAKFNLIDKPWIPVLRHGRVQEVGIAEALMDAHNIERIETASPLEEVALHRLLLAILHRALPPVRHQYDAVDLLDRGRFDHGLVGNYLARFRDRFFLIDDSAPFMQVAGLPDSDPSPWTRLLPDLASGNNPTLFDHTTHESFPTASYAEAARALVLHQQFAPGGLVKRLGVTSAKDAPLARAAAFLPCGDSLFETLVLNLVPYSPDQDRPLWEVPPLTSNDVQCHATKWPLSGVTRVYTWPSRGVRLLDQGTGVRYMAYGPGVEPLEAGDRDRMVAYRHSRGKHLPLRMSTERSFWRDFAAMLPASGGVWPATLEHAARISDETGTPYRLRVLGQIAKQAEKAKILDVRREVYPLPRGFLNPQAIARLEAGLQLADTLGSALQKVARHLARSLLGDRDPKELRNFSESLPLMRLYWTELDSAFPRFLDALASDDALEHWRDALRRAAQISWSATTDFVGVQPRHLAALARGEHAFARALSTLRR